MIHRRPITVFALLALGLLVSCLAADGEGNGGGSGGGGNTGSDVVVRGTLCPIGDLRSPNACSITPTVGTKVVERGSGKSALATATAAFNLSSKADARTVLEVGFGQRNFQPSVVTVALSRNGADGVLIPVVESKLWEKLRQSVGAIEPDGTASMAVYVQRQGRPVAGAEVLPPAGTSSAVVYDGLSPLSWLTGATGSAGAALIFGIPAVAATTELVVIAPGGGARATYSQLPITAGGTTFVFVELPAI